jgi:hypothetical protein
MTKEKTKVKGWDTIDALRKGKTIIARFYKDDWIYHMKKECIYKLAKNGTWQRAPYVKLDDLLSFEFEIIPAIPEPTFNLRFMDAYRLMKSGRKVVNDIVPNQVYYLENGRVGGISDHFSFAEIDCMWRVVE